MSKKRGTMVGAGLIALLLTTASLLQPSAAQEPPPPIASEFLTPRSVFTDNVDLKVKFRLSGQSTKVVNVKDPSRTVVARFTVQPGARFPWHTHPGPVFVNMVSGELVYVDSDDCLERAYSAGTAFVDPGHGHVHTAFNRTGTVTVFVATFFEAPATGPLLIPADPAC
ncbi:cupin domain-containing protein [Kribbella sp. NPDC050124]|uniref:cupin domain-containing protein n=1 Tax=Kribbella sp. NPDC050124 TaxID=3364114 RepID=UPI003790E25A